MENYGKDPRWTRMTSQSRRAGIIIRDFIERQVSVRLTCSFFSTLEPGYSFFDVIGALGNHILRVHNWPRWTSKKPNPVYQPTDPPSPLLVTYSVTADDQDDFDSPLVRPRKRQRCIKVMIRRVVKEEHVKILISPYSRTEHWASWLPVFF